jgi:phage host-nuclease inhibitor protein Gam
VGTKINLSRNTKRLGISQTELAHDEQTVVNEDYAAEVQRVHHEIQVEDLFARLVSVEH